MRMSLLSNIQRT